MSRRTSAAIPSTFCSARIGVIGLLFLTACASRNPVGNAEVDPCDAGPIAVGESVEGTLDAEDCVVGRVTGPSASAGRSEEHWRLTLAERTTVVIDVRYAPSRSDMLLYLEDAYHMGLDIQSPGLFPSPIGGEDALRIVETLDAATYVLRIGVTEPESATYTLSTRTVDCSPVGTLVPGNAVSGTLTASDCPFEFGTASDNWTVPLGPTQSIRIDLMSADFSPALALLGPHRVDKYVGFGYGYDTGSWDHVRFYLAATPPDGSGGDGWPGDRTIAVTTGERDGSGAYELRASLSPPCGPNTEIGLGAIAREELSDTDCFREWGITEDTWLLTLTHDAAVTLRMSTTDFTPSMRLKIGDDLYLYAGNNSPGLLQPGTIEISPSRQTNELLAAGSYQWIIGGSGGDPRGVYELTVVADTAWTPS